MYKDFHKMCLRSLMTCFGCLFVDTVEEEEAASLVKEKKERTNYNALLYAEGNRFISNADL